MINDILSKIENKNIAILGFGIEGKSTYKFIRRYFPTQKLEILYQKQDSILETEITSKDENVFFISGKNYLTNLEKYDLIFKSPGISFKDIDTTSFENKITSQLELFLDNMSNFTIGITGTKGKSTTSSLIYKMLIDQKLDAYLLGNIGTPIFDKIEEIKENSILVLEISSHTLQYLKASTNIAILLNIYEEHLDHYKSFEEYALAKINLLKYQKQSDIAIFNSDNETILKLNKYIKQNDFSVSLKNNNIANNTVTLDDDFICINNEKIYNKNSKRNLKGEHNLNNIMFVLAVAKILKLNFAQVEKTINLFEPLEHRLEFVGKIEGVDYYNDSIATIPEATIESIKALGNVNTLLVGGNDRGVNLSELIKFLANCQIGNIICLPKTGEYIAKGLENTNKQIYNVKTIEEAVNVAKQVTRKGQICLLSPAASSYGYFKNFIERGNRYKEALRK